MIALRSPLRLELGIATALTAGLWLAVPEPAARPWRAPVLSVETPPEHLAIRSQTRVCDLDGITEVVIRGQFTSYRPGDSFAISFGSHAALTDTRGYFEVRIPREHFAGNLCELPSGIESFHDDQMTLHYRLTVE